MQNIRASDLPRMLEITDKIKAIKYYIKKKAVLVETIESMTPTEKTMFTFFCWFAILNTKWKAIEVSRYYYTPTGEVNKVTFHDFIRLLRRFNGMVISKSREPAVAKFLSLCDKPHKDFFLSVLSRSWIRDFTVTDLQQRLDLDSISGEEVYGGVAYLRTSFSELTYPVALRSVPNFTILSRYIFTREPYSNILKYITDEHGIVNNLVRPKVKLEADISTSPRFTLGGYHCRDEFFPFDYFSCKEEVEDYLEGREVTPYAVRIEGLNNHLTNNLVVLTDDSPLALVSSEDELPHALNKVIGSAKWADILITDNNSLRSGVTHKVTCRVATGAIAEMWIEEGQAKGVKIWFNGVIAECGYTFKGKENSLLSNPDSIKGATFEFFYIKIGGNSYLIGNAIRWGQKRWRTRKQRATFIDIDKCILCGGTNWRHANHGICSSCEANLPYYFEKYGVGTWIEPSGQMQKKRWASSWEPSLLNAAKYRHKGNLLVADEDGRWQFKEDAEAMEQYKIFLERRDGEKAS